MLQPHGISYGAVIHVPLGRSMARVSAIVNACLLKHPLHLPPRLSMPATRSTTKRQRETQNFRQSIARQNFGDYHKCKSCGGLFSLYHNAHKRHVQLCEARSKRLGDEEAQRLAERYTPTPEPYTHVSSAEDTEIGLGVEFPMEVVMDHGVPVFENLCLSFLC
jgi:hypothetical protein